MNDLEHRVNKLENKALWFEMFAWFIAGAVVWKIIEKVWDWIFG